MGAVVTAYRTPSPNSRPAVRVRTMAESRKSSDYKLIWDVRRQTPFTVANTTAHSFGACVGDKAYFLPDRESSVVYEYLSTTGEWRGLPPCGVRGCALANIRGKLTTVSGRLRGGGLSDCLCWDETSRCWMARYPPAPASCFWPVVATTVDHLIAVETFGDQVHVMDVNTSQWSSVAGLPDHAHGAFRSVAICNETVYVTCLSAASPMFHCSLGALLHSTAQQTNVWQVLVCPSMLPFCPILVTVNNKLLAIGIGNTFMFEEEEKTFLSVKSTPFYSAVSMACVLPGEKLVLCGNNAGDGVFCAGRLSSPAGIRCKDLAILH